MKMTLCARDRLLPLQKKGSEEIQGQKSTVTWRGAMGIVVGLVVMVLAVMSFHLVSLPPAQAYNQWSTARTSGNCADCHGSFRASGYTSRRDGSSWSTSLHTGHETNMLSGDCNTCHSGSSKFPVLLATSTGGTGLPAVSCLGCHGRPETGVTPPGKVTGTGLRQHHYKVGITECLSCHYDAKPKSLGGIVLAVAENVKPPYYFSPDTNHPNKPIDPCNDSILASALGLDKDGNNLYGSSDPACVPADTTPPTVSLTMPATSSSLTVPITVTATDNAGGSGVAGYMVKEVSAVPSAGDGGWSATAPTSYTFGSAGTKTLYAWAKDGAGNVSTTASATTTITLPDTTPPTVSLTMPATSSSLTVPITVTATDNAGGSGVAGYMVKEVSAVPSAGDGGWSATAPTSYTFGSAGTKTLYAWAKDGAGNVSTTASATTTITLPDTTPPTVSLTMPAISSSLTVPITVTATDNPGGSGVAGYMVKEVSTVPSAGDGGWSATAPTSYTFGSAGTKTLYAWAKDGAGNVSTTASATTTITLPDTTPPTVAITFPVNGQTVSGTIIIRASASDDIGVIGVQFEIDGVAAAVEDTSAPYSISWNTAAVSNGVHVLTAVARDEAGNQAVSEAVSVTVENSPPDGNIPDMSVWLGKWFEVIIDDHKEDNIETFRPDFVQDRENASEDVLGYMKIWAWDPTNRILNGDLYMFDVGTDQWYWIDFPLHYISGNPLNFLCWSELEGETTYGFTARFHGKKKKNVLVRATFKTKPYSQALSKKIVQSINWDAWVRTKGVLIPESEVPIPSEVIVH
jgi:hypothetical protein